MKYIARKPFRYGPRVYMAGEAVTVKTDDVRMLQGQGKIGGPVRETATVKPVENAMQPQAEPKTDYTVAELRKILKEKGLPTYGKKEELLKRLEK